ncbi:MAG: 50S ribosomal protein L24 [Patescibacteria group bacterium]
MKIKQGDKVMVIAGRDKGKQGVVIKTFRDKNKVIVDGVNIKKKHIKSSDQNEGGIVEMSHPIDASNVSLIDPVSGKPTRVKIDRTSGKKVRIAKSSGKSLD